MIDRLRGLAAAERKDADDQKLTALTATPVGKGRRVIAEMIIENTAAPTPIAMPEPLTKSSVGMRQ